MNLFTEYPITISTLDHVVVGFGCACVLERLFGFWAGMCIGALAWVVIFCLH